MAVQKSKVEATPKKKIKKNVPSGNVYIQASFNNTIITFTDPQGGVISWSTAGSSGFKGSRKGTPFAAQLAAETAAKKALDAGMRNINVYINGPGGGREASLRAFNALGFKVGMVKDMTPIPHNGCRPAKRRRV